MSIPRDIPVNDVTTHIGSLRGNWTSLWKVELVVELCSVKRAMTVSSYLSYTRADTHYESNATPTLAAIPRPLRGLGDSQMNHCTTNTNHFCIRTPSIRIYGIAGKTKSIPVQRFHMRTCASVESDRSDENVKRNKNDSPCSSHPSASTRTH